MLPVVDVLVQVLKSFFLGNSHVMICSNCKIERSLQITYFLMSNYCSPFTIFIRV